MLERRTALAVITAFALVATGVAQGSQGDDWKTKLDALRAEEEEIDTRLFERLREFPGEEHVELVNGKFRELGLKAGPDVEMIFPSERRQLTISDQPSPITIHPLIFRGTTRYEKIEEFLSRIELYDFSPVHLESLEVEAESDETVRFVMHLQIPFYDYQFDFPEPDLHRSGLVEYVRQQVAFRRSLLEQLEDLVALKNTDAVSRALAMFDERIGSGAVRLVRARFDEQLLLEGVAVGAAARASVLDGVEAAGLDVRESSWTPLGVCHSFSLLTRIQPGEREKELTIGNGPFGSDADCRQNAQREADQVELLGTGSGEASLDLHLEDVDVADIFFILNDLTGESFVIGQDVRGRADLRLKDATLEESLEAMKVLDIVTRDGPIRLVHAADAAGMASAETPEVEGAVVDVMLDDVCVQAVLCTFKQLAGLDILAAPEIDPHVSLFVTGQPWDLVILSALEAGRLSHVIDGTALYVGNGEEGEPSGRERAADVCENFWATSRLADMRLTLRDLGAEDLQLLGTVRAADGWRAYLYTPWRRIVRANPGDEVFGGRIESIHADGVVLDADGSVQELTLRRSGPP